MSLSARLSVCAVGGSFVILVTTCGGTPPSPVGPTALNGAHVIGGVVVGMQTRRPVPGASIELTHAGNLMISTDSAGRFTAPSVPEGTLLTRITASGHLTYTSRIHVSRSRDDLTLALISLEPPFSLDFYRQFARNGAESSVLNELRPWTVSPSFYVRTRTEDSGDDIPADVIEALRRVFGNSVAELSGGRLAMAAFEAGPDPRASRDGWVNVRWQRELLDGGAIGQASVGGNTGTMQLVYDPEAGMSGWECEALAVAVADHEIVHTMGFWHTAPPAGDGGSDFQSGVGCPGRGRPARTLHHAAVAYGRPPGNRDPDSDPDDFSIALEAGGRRSGPVVTCQLENTTGGAR